MLILDKQKAMERVVALSAATAQAGDEKPAQRRRSRARQRVATYEPAPDADFVAVPAPAAQPRRVRRRPAARPAPA